MQLWEIEIRDGEPIKLVVNEYKKVFDYIDRKNIENIIGINLLEDGIDDLWGIEAEDETNRSGESHRKKGEYNYTDISTIYKNLCDILNCINNRLIFDFSNLQLSPEFKIDPDLVIVTKPVMVREDRCKPKTSQKTGVARTFSLLRQKIINHYYNNINRIIKKRSK